MCIRDRVHARAGAQGQRAFARGQVDDGAVGAVDDLAVAVDAQAGGVGVEQAVDDQVALGGQADAADLLAAGVDAAIDGQAAACLLYTSRYGREKVEENKNEV